MATATDTIFVAAGTYKPSTTDNQGEYFNVTAGKKIFGGFAGTEAWLTQRNIAANPTILSGDIGLSGDNSDNSDIVIVFSQTPAGTRLDGFTVSGGNNGSTSGALSVGGGEANIANCYFENNTAYIGGAVHGGGATVNIDHCTFFNNLGGANGGAIAGNASVFYVTHSAFLSNTGNDSGGAYIGQNNSSATFVNCLFGGNKANNYQGAAIYVEGGSTTLTNCTVVNNTNRQALAFPSGGGLLQNCIVWNNTNGPGYGFDASYSLIEGGWGGTGNINADPLFAGANDFHILQCSPAANTGNDAAVPGGITTDLDGNPRFFSHFSSSTVDMGAYELQNHSIIPAVYEVSGVASDCAGGNNAPVMISNSQLGVNYQWKVDGTNEGSPVAGTGSALVFNAPTTNGIYTASATSISGCSVGMTGFAKVFLGSLPATISSANQLTGDTLFLNTGGRPLMSIEWQRNGNTIFREPSIFEPNATTVAGGNGYGSAANQLASPLGLGFDAAGNLYVSDGDNHRVQRFAPGTTVGVTVAGGNGYGSTDNQLANPQGLWVAPDGTLYIADRDNHRIQKWAPGATNGVTVAGGNGYGNASNQLASPQGIFVDTNGDLYIADSDNHRVQKWAFSATDGTTVAGGNGSGAQANQTRSPDAVLLAGGYLYIAERNNHRVSKWLPGAVSGVTVAGGNGEGASLNQLDSPVALLMDAEGNLLVCESGYPNYRVTKWLPGATKGIIMAGGVGFGGNAPNQLYNPSGLALDAFGALYVSDLYNYRVQKFAPSVQPFIVMKDCGTWQAVVTDMVGCTATSNTLGVLTRWYADTDNDGYGNVAVFLDACPQPSGYVTNSTDCNDAEVLSNPGLQEICNDGIDNNCDGFILEFTAPTVTTPSYTACAGETLQISTGTQDVIQWYDAPTGGNLVATGNTISFTAANSTTLYAQKAPFQFGGLGSVSTQNALVSVNHESLTGDDGRGIAITPDYLFYTGDTKTVRYDHNLQNGVQLPQLDGLFSDLATGQLYGFRNGSSFSSSNIDRIQPFDIMGQPVGNPIMLSQALTSVGSSSSIVFNGFGYVLFYHGNGDDFYRIALPSGQVTLLKENYILSDHEDAESHWAWYMSEFNGGTYSVVYRKRNTNLLVRLNLTTEQVTVVTEFEKAIQISSSGDAAQFVFSPWDNRLFYHNEHGNGYNSLGSSTGESLTSFAATNLLQCSAPRTPVAINVTPCAAPGNPNIRAGSVTYTSAILDWTPVSTCNGNVPTDVYFSASNTAPVVGTIPTFDNVAVDSVRFFYLECGTIYYAWLRTDCGSQESAWVGPILVTTQSLTTPTVSPTSAAFCASGTANFTATLPEGAEIVWFDAASGGVAVDSGAVFSVAASTTTSYYAEMAVFDSLPGSATFDYTGGAQTFVVPAGVTSIAVVAKGASGGKPGWLDDSYYGKGGKVATTLAVTPGQTLHLYVGGAGTFPTSFSQVIVAGFNGGGEDDDGSGGGGGGGATDIRIGGTDLSHRVLVAGGGGGATVNNTAGGHGGDLTGAAGAGLNPNEGGAGGTQAAGGVGGTGDFSSGDGANGYPGALGIGGDGGGIPNDFGGYATGGGGGGYYGGGGGGTYGGAGGGGSSYTDPTLCANVVHTQGDNIGDGVIELAWVAYRTCTSPTRTQVTVNISPSPTAISTAGLSACNNQGTGCSPDDSYTANVTVTYPSKPASGTLVLSGADLMGAPLSVNVSAIGATSHSFTGVVLRADGQAISLTATFSEGNCAFTNNNAGMAPASCSSGGADTQKPTITCPANQTRTTDAGQCTASVTYTTPIAADNCFLPFGQPVWVSGGSMPVPSGANSVATFNKGITVVQWKATDGAGLTKTCTFRVTVNDSERPALTCPAPITANTGAGGCTASITYTNPTFTDNCAPTSGTALRISGPASGSAMSVGASSVVFRATDASGNTQTCSMQVTVIDNALPTITCPPSTTVTGSGSSCNATVGYTSPTATDNCYTPSVFLLSGLASGSPFPAGTTTVVWRAVVSGGQSSECSFTVTVSCGTSADGMLNDRTMNPERQGGSPALSLALAPNPATAEVMVSVSGLGEGSGELTVFDAQGRMMFQPSAVSREPATIDLTDFPTGLYFVTLRSDGAVVTKRLMVSKL